LNRLGIQLTEVTIDLLICLHILNIILMKINGNVFETEFSTI